MSMLCALELDINRNKVGVGESSKFKNCPLTENPKNKLKQ